MEGCGREGGGEWREGKGREGVGELRGMGGEGKERGVISE